MDYSIRSRQLSVLLWDAFVKELIPFEIEDLFPSNALGGAESGCMSLRAKETSQLVDAQKRLNEELYQLFGSCPAEHDDD